jgi:hypothetical protein
MSCIPAHAPCFPLPTDSLTRACLPTQIDYLGSTYVDDIHNDDEPPARRQLLQGGNTGTLLVRMATLLPSSQVGGRQR